MSAPAHTPGPWKVNRRSGVIVGADSNSVCVDEGNAPGDMDLIAAAPALLTACKDCLEGRGDWVSVMTAAIAKAEGRT